MIEVEIRAKIKDLKRAKSSLLDLGANLVNSERQIDKVFGRATDLDKNHQIIEGHFSARVRQKGEKKLVEFKEIKRTGAGLEFSSNIIDIADGVHLLTSLDFEEAFTIDKVRALYRLNDFEICLDQVEKLGNFIEIEKGVEDKGSIDNTLLQCKELLGKIDPGAVLEPKKYGDLMQELINEGIK